VSAALMAEVAAKAGVANTAGVASKTAARLILAAERAARHDSAPMVFPQPYYDFTNRIPGVVAGCDADAST
jgi:hypothetical protein